MLGAGPCSGAAAEVEGLSLGAEDDAGELGVAGRPAGPGGGQDPAEAELPAGRSGGGVEQVLQVHLDRDVRLDGAQQRQGAAAEMEVGELHQGVGLLLGVRALVAGGPVGLPERLQRSLHLLPADRVEVEPAGEAAVGVLGEAEEPLLGGVGLGPVLVDARDHLVDECGQLVVRADSGEAGQHLVDAGEVAALLREEMEVARCGDPPDHRHLIGGQRA